jgi:hypothetical protein
LHNAFARVARVNIGRADHYGFDSGLDYRICARSSAPCRGAWLQCNVQRGAGRQTRAEIAQALNLRMVTTRLPMVSFCYYSIVNNQNRSDRRIWAGLAEPLFRFFQRSTHEFYFPVSPHSS